MHTFINITLYAISYTAIIKTRKNCPLELNDCLIRKTDKHARDTPTNKETFRKAVR